ncbi:Crp/Fnr family transcriptional regulator [Aeromonas veronii]|uniref:Crp/Fnr family transcriptional regulator n=1 Tax=Aeromonas TaxID=642 RepID=UPI0022EB55AA|nr:MULTISPECIES: Crp/Fnr family transcriptional regulator [Aeromonas]KAJ8739732.1 Crp/Fnr family transcriptional regulator [Aeromonas veronii]MDA3317645.1 Crp/Fnr family transcriptional regulator [Aeromonas sp. PI_26]
MLIDRPPFDWAQVADKEEAARLLSFARPLTLSPKSCLWHAGDSPDLLVRVEQGLLRAKLVLEDGREYIKEFYWEGDEFLDFHHLLSGEPARYSVEALDPCRLQLFQLADLRQLPGWPRWYQHLLEVQLRIKEEKEQLLLTGSPQARYQHFLDSFPTLDARVPDHQIAAYLGITPISLSRIRKRLKELNKG